MNSLIRLGLINLIEKADKLMDLAIEALEQKVGKDVLEEKEEEKERIPTV